MAVVLICEISLALIGPQADTRWICHCAIRPTLVLCRVNVSVKGHRGAGFNRFNLDTGDFIKMFLIRSDMICLAMLYQPVLQGMDN